MIIISKYTAEFSAAMRPTCPRVGQLVGFAESCDDRQVDDFNRLLRNNGLMADNLVRWMPRKKINVYRIERI